MHAERNYTTQLQAGLGMIPETLDLLRLWEPGLIPTHLADRAVETGLFSRTTARRARNLVAEMFAPRFLADEGVVASRIKYLLEHRFARIRWFNYFSYKTARAQQVFGEFVTEVYWPKYSAGAATLSKDDSERFLRQALDMGRMQKRWSDATIGRVSGYLLGCCIDFGLLAATRRAARPIKRFSIRMDVALYLAHDLHFAGHSDMAVIQHPDWRLFGLEVPEVLQLIKSISHDGHLFIQSSVDLVQISWKYHTMEECLDALTQR